MFLSLDLLSEYRIHHGAIGALYVTSSYSTWIFCRGVSGFAIDCPCDVWCRGLSTCLLHVGPPFGNRFLNTSWAVVSTYWIIYLHFLYFDICNYICLDTSYWLYLYFLNILYFFKYFCTNIFHRRSLCTFYFVVPTWVLSAPDGPYVSPMNLAIRDCHCTGEATLTNIGTGTKWIYCITNYDISTTYKMKNAQIMEYTVMGNSRGCSRQILNLCAHVCWGWQRWHSLWNMIGIPIITT